MDRVQLMSQIRPFRPPRRWSWSSWLWPAGKIIIIIIILIFICFSASVFQLFTLQIKLVWISFNTKNNQRFKAHFFAFYIIFEYQEAFSNTKKHFRIPRSIFREEKKQFDWLFTLSPRSVATHYPPSAARARFT